MGHYQIVPTQAKKHLANLTKQYKVKDMEALLIVSRMTGAIDILEKREGAESALPSIVSNISAIGSSTFFFHPVFFGPRANY
jgi:hypothetical protein